MRKPLFSRPAIEGLFGKPSIAGRLKTGPHAAKSMKQLPLSAPTQPHRNVYTVSGLNREVRLLLEHGLPVVWLEGELSNFSAPSSGHWYFSLKDREAQIRCAMFRMKN